MPASANGGFCLGVRMNTFPAEDHGQPFSIHQHANAQELVEKLPLPGLILRRDASLLYMNELGRRHITPPWLDGAAARLVEMASGFSTCELEIQGSQNVNHTMVAYAIPLGELIVVAFADRLSSSETADAMKMQQRIAELERLVAIDRLTGLRNRREFDKMVKRELEFSEQQRSPVSLLLFDLDHFKKVNDRFGHAVGDDVLRSTAGRLSWACRPTDLLFRWGGEEFALLTPATSMKAATVVGERLRTHLAAKPFDIAGELTVSVGLAEHQLGETAEHWFERADAALYQAKKRGRNRLSVAAGGASDIWGAQEQVSALQLVWSDRYVSGHGLIDQEHRGLFDATNALIASMVESSLDSNAVMAQLDDLLIAITRHFSDEENVLAEIGYTGLESHQRLHRTLLEKSQRLRDAVHAGASSPAEVVEFLANEVVNRHVLKVDRLFFPLLGKSVSH